MGMFDYVDVGEPPVPCPKCGEDLKGWQTKDTECELETVPWIRTVSFYTSCGKCSTWVQYRRDEEIVLSRFEGFTQHSRPFGSSFF